MFRAILELLATILVAMVVRAVISGLMKGFSSFSAADAPPAAAQQAPRPAAPNAGPQIAGELHRDPVCGTFVAESTPFSRQSGRQIFYYCSQVCRDKHTLVPASPLEHLSTVTSPSY